MKTIAMLAVLATSLIGGAASGAHHKNQRSYAIFFYERPTGFADRSNGNASGYWSKWTRYIGSIQQSGAMESGSALVSPETSATLDAKGAAKLDASEIQLSGYIVVKADSLEAATSIAAKSPAIADGGKVEVRELLPMSAHQGQNR